LVESPPRAVPTQSAASAQARWKARRTKEEEDGEEDEEEEEEEEEARRRGAQACRH
jgi:ribosomal protein L12E/L44/L45/RPP1/RPP2